ncbi:MAG: hypothetical protein JO225_01900 [Candidatus Eremiobacteraeota bacterium]|nr:hypothetical protein [Candidatus Eremiobacteraeota bacterium]MBV8642651.1 hypothetical protein [Candidatus Eremiobacteraeota bacterium]
MSIEQVTVQYPVINSSQFVAYSGARIVFSDYYVTGQPAPVTFPVMKQVGIANVVCVRDPSENNEQPPPTPAAPDFNPSEGSELAAVGIRYQNIPVTRSMSQAQFNVAATQAADAVIVAGSRAPVLVHCSSGDRASSVFAVLLIRYVGITNAEASEFAQNSLLLSNQTMIERVLGYSSPRIPEELQGLTLRR